MCVGMKIKAFVDEVDVSQTFISKKTQIPLIKFNLALNDKRKMIFEEYEFICGVQQVNKYRFLISRKINKN